MNHKESEIWGQSIQSENFRLFAEHDKKIENVYTIWWKIKKEAEINEK